MNIISWNVAGLRDRIKNDETLNNSLMRALFSQVTNNGIGYKYFDIVCLQETKCTETEGEKVLTDNIKKYIINPEKDNSLRVEAMNRFHNFKDGNNCQRILNFINTNLDKN